MQGRVRRGAIFSAAVALLLGGGARGWGAPDPSERLFTGTGTCPTAAAVRAEVETLVPRERLNARLRAAASSGAGTGAGAPVEIVDLGVPFKVVAAGSVREYRDETRDCGYRARVAAIFVALVIDPAAIVRARPSTPPEATVAAPPVAPPASVTPVVPVAPFVAAAAPAPSARARPRVQLALGAAVEGGIGSDARVGTAGLALRVGFGAGRLALSAGAAAIAPVDTTIGGIRVHQWRLPADVSVRAQGAIRVGEHNALEPYGELGVAVALLREGALDLANPQTRTSTELGLRAAAGVQWVGASRIAPFLELHGELVPSPPTISALPRGVVGHTPQLWLGATAGATWRFF